MNYSIYSEIVSVDNDIIKTWNKKDGQLIIDRRIKGDIAIFDLFNKDFTDITLGSAKIQNKIIMIDFDISSKVHFVGKPIC